MAATEVLNNLEQAGQRNFIAVEFVSSCLCDAKFSSDKKYSPCYPIIMGRFFANFNTLISSFEKKYRGPILAGLLMGTSYIPFPPWALWFCFAPLWVFILRDSSSLKSAFIGGWLTQFLLTLIGFHWIAYVSHEYGYLPWSVSVIILLIFCASMHLYIPFSTFLTRWLQNKLQLSMLSTALVGASLFALGEAFWPSIFPWNLGYPLLSAKIPAAQTADVFGIWGLSWFLHISSALMAWAWLRKSFKLKIGTVSGILIFWLTLSIWGHFKKQDWSNPTQLVEKNVLIIQANIGNFEKIMAEKGRGYQQSIADTYFSLTKQGLTQHPETDLIVWPESSYPDYLDTYDLNQAYSRQFVDFTQQIKKPILLGAYSRDPAGTQPRQEYNGLFLFDEHGTLTNPPYHKTYLLAFGEYTPFAKQFPILAKYSPAGEGFARGKGPMVFSWGNDKIGLQICYESLDPQFSSQLSHLGADYLVNVTNDSWFGPTFEPYQHLYMTLARAIEVRRPLIRSTNTGISTVVSANGDWGKLSPLYKTWYGLYKLQYKPQAEQTFYAQFGHNYPWILMFILIVIIYANHLRNKNLHRSMKV